MRKLKEKSKRIIIILVSFVAISTMLIGMDIGLLKADATINNFDDYCPVTFLVPETIYLKPQIGSSNTFEYFVDSENDGTLRAPGLDIIDYDNYGANGYDYIKYGYLYFNCPKSTLVVISCTGATPFLSNTSGETTVDAIINGGIMASNVPENSGRTIKWTATYMVNGKTRTAHAYSYCYAPFYESIASAIQFENDDGVGVGNRAHLHTAAWVSGIHGYSPPKGWICNTSSGKILAPLLGGVTPPPDENTFVTEWMTNAAGGVSFASKTSGKNDYLIVLNSATGYLTVDTSRYTSYNQIPNLTVGMMVTNIRRQDSWVKGYISDYTGQALYLTDQTSDSESIMKECYNTKGIQIGNEYDSKSTGIKYDQVINDRAITRNRTGSETYIFKGCVYGANDGEDIVHSMLCPVNVSFVNKSALRSKVRQYYNLGLQSLDYTSSSWSAFNYALSNAAERLGNPKEVNISTTALDNAYNALVKLTYTATATYMLPCSTGAVGLVNSTQKADSADGEMDGFITVKETKTFNSNDSVIFCPTNFEGYTASSAFGATSSIETITLEDQNSNISVTYIYEPEVYTVSLNYGSDSEGGYEHRSYTSTYNTSSINAKYNHTYASQGLPTPTMAGWRFNGWYSTSDYSANVMPSTVMTQSASHTVYAKWTPYFSGGHGYKTGDVVNRKTLDYNDMFLISDSDDFDRIDNYDSNYYYLNSSGFSYKQTNSIILN